MLLEVFSRLEEPEFHRIIIQALSNNNPRIRYMVIYCLIQNHDRDVHKQILELSRSDEDSLVKEIAQQYLKYYENDFQDVRCWNFRYIIE